MYQKLHNWMPLFHDKIWLKQKNEIQKNKIENMESGGNEHRI